MPKRHVLLVPMAFDLEKKDLNAPVELGTGTRFSINHALDCEHRHSQRAVIFLSATKAPDYGNVVMGKMMQDYVRQRSARIETAFEEASRFDTVGELAALSDYILKMKAAGDEVHEVIIFVKDWHADRVSKLVKELFKRRALSKIPVHIRRHSLPRKYNGSWFDHFKEPFKTQAHLALIREMYP